MKRRLGAIILGGLSLGLLLLLPHAAGAGPTYYVDAVNGNDSYSKLEAQNPATPWRTINNAMQTGGDDMSIITRPQAISSSISVNK